MKKDYLKEKSLWARIETLKIHKIAPETRIASSLSSVEIFAAFYYGGALKFYPKNPQAENRDRLIVSKGHGSISLYPILADLGYFSKSELKKVCREGSFLGAIPDTMIPGYETINGSMGHGLGVACGIALALKLKKSKASVFVVMGDGELYEGSVWEAIMFAGHHKLDNLILVVDNNKICMLDFCKNVLDLEPLEDKFRVFKWLAKRVDGHNALKVRDSLLYFKNKKAGQPKVLIADTRKGKGVACLEKDPLCHIKSLKPEEVDKLIEGLKC